MMIAQLFVCARDWGRYAIINTLTIHIWLWVRCLALSIGPCAWTAKGYNSLRRRYSSLTNIEG